MRMLGRFSTNRFFICVAGRFGFIPGIAATAFSFMYAGKDIQYFAEVFAKVESLGLREDIQKVSSPAALPQSCIASLTRSHSALECSTS